MADGCADVVLDFDLDFLHHNNDVTVLSKLEKQRKAVLVAKKKTIATDSLIKKYYDKKEVLDQIEKSLFESKEECKQICIEYRNTLQKVTYLEESEQKLRNANQELEERCAFSETRCSALQSHATQLQLLVKDHEKKLESMEMENHLCKTNIKECDKKVSSLERENNVMLQHILVLKDIVLGKKKLNKKAREMLKKYKGKSEDSDDSTSDSKANDSCAEVYDATDFTDCDTQDAKIPISKLVAMEPALEIQNVDNTQKSPLHDLQETAVIINSPSDNIDKLKQTDMGIDSDGSNEIILSVDTGRGSSLAYSDNEKCFLSPDQFEDSPPGSVAAASYSESCNGVANNKINTTNRANRAGASMFDEPVESATQIEKISEQYEPQVTATSPNQQTASNAFRFVIESPSDDEKEVTERIEQESSTNYYLNPLVQKTIANKSKTNNINNSDENSDDYEVSAILNKMSLPFSMISPFPPSPSSMSNCSVTDIDTKIHSCQEAAEMREENKVLQASIASLAQQVMEIKSMLKSHCGNLISRPVDLSAHEEVSRRTSSLGPPEAVLKFKDVTLENNFESLNENSKDTETACVVVERQYHKASFERSQEDHLEATKDNEITNRSPALKQQISNDHDKEHEELRKANSPVGKVRDSFHFTSVPTSDKVKDVVEMEERDTENWLIQVSDLCDDQTTVVGGNLEEELLVIIEESSEPSSINHHSIISNDGEARDSSNDSEGINNSTNSVSILNDSEATNSINTNEIKGKLVERLLFDDSSLSEDYESETDKVPCSKEKESLSNNCDINLKLYDICNNNHTKQICRKNKLTKLEKIRKRLQPKSKIKIAASPKKSSKKLKHTDVSSASPNLMTSKKLNDKAVYEKALAVVAELRAKQKNKNEKALVTRSGRIVTRGESDNKTELIQSSKRLEKSQVLKFRHSPRLICDDMEIRKTSTTNRNKSNAQNKRCATSEIETNSITTRSRSKGIVSTPVRKTRPLLEGDKQGANSNEKDPELLQIAPSCEKIVADDNYATTMISPERRNSLKRPCVDKSLIDTKRKLRSFTEKQSQSTEIEVSDKNIVNVKDSTVMSCVENDKRLNLPCKDYSDIDIFNETTETTSQQKTGSDSTNHPKESILCKMIEKYGVNKNFKFGLNQIPASITDTICMTLEQSITSIKELPPGASKVEMNRLVDDIKGLPYKHFVSGLTKYLKAPTRKEELYNKITTPPAPPMSKTEQILLYLISHLNKSWTAVDIVEEIMKNIEFTLFRLGQAPDFDVIESLSHFYAVLCRYSKAKNRLRLFVLDAMYCLNYKAMPLIKTCIDVWMHVLPLSHMGIAKSPLVICLVYLLHYYKCKDYFNRVQDIRYLLKKRYSFEMTEWNETKMLGLLKNAILELCENSTEKKMLRIALIILAKRQGPKWCQANILKRILLPLLDKEELPERVRDFCVSMLGPLMKPYPNEMKVHCEIVLNQLFELLEQNCSQRMQEAIFTSLLFIQKHDSYRVTQALLAWRPQQEISQHLEELLREFVREKPVKVWTRILANCALG